MPGRSQRRQERGRQQRRLERLSAQRRSSARWWVPPAALAVVLLLGGAAYAVLQRRGGTATGAQPGTPIRGVPCQREMVAYHVHSHLTLYRDGRPAPLPANVGIPVTSAIPGNTCLYWLHTHDTRGVVHVESPQKQSFTLGQLVDIWRATGRWDAQGGFGYTVDTAFAEALTRARPGTVRAFVGARPVRAWRAIALGAHTLITVELGTPVRPPTTRYTFAAGE